LPSPWFANQRPWKTVPKVAMRVVRLLAPCSIPKLLFSSFISADTSGSVCDFFSSLSNLWRWNMTFVVAGEMKSTLRVYMVVIITRVKVCRTSTFQICVRLETTSGWS